jgi:1-deoxy-D-xylulose-5-phosphate reductoisomerase
MAKRSVSILGATGSIGDSTLDLIRHHKDDCDVRVLTAGNNVDKLITLAKEFTPQYLAIANEDHYQTLRSQCPECDILSVEDAASVEADWTMAAIVGTAGLKPTMNAIERGQIVAFASKECLVAAGHLMMDAVRASGAILLPVDSEHNAIFQVFENHNRDSIKRLILTASGGPFRTWDWSKMVAATPEQAVSHPTWSMGAKISVDSATLMNKALEVIEAHYLFDVPSDQIDVIIHPQSTIHSMVEYHDGSVLSQMGPSDMRTPIVYCLGYPDRPATSGPMMNFDGLTELTFEQPDLKRFPSLAMVRDVLKSGQASCIIFNAANEVANAAFLKSQIGFTMIYDVIDFCLSNMQNTDINSLGDVMALDTTVRQKAEDYINNNNKKAHYA